MIVRPITRELEFRTERRVPKVGLMMVGWGGNNGSTVTGTILANKLQLQWKTKTGLQASACSLAALDRQLPIARSIAY